MKPIDFKEANDLVTIPGSISDLEYRELNVFSNGREFTSAWKPSLRERLSIFFGGKIWLSVHAAKHPPVWIDIKNCSNRIINK